MIVKGRKKFRGIFMHLHIPSFNFRLNWHSGTEYVTLTCNRF